MDSDASAVIARYIEIVEMGDDASEHLERYFNVAAPYKNGILLEVSLRGMSLIAQSAPIIDYRQNTGMVCELSYEDSGEVVDAMLAQGAFALMIVPQMEAMPHIKAIKCGKHMFSMLYSAGEVPMGIDCALIIEGSLDTSELRELEAAGGVLVYDGTGRHSEHQEARRLSFTMGREGELAIHGWTPELDGIRANYESFCHLVGLNTRLRSLSLGTNAYPSHEGFRALYKVMLGKEPPAPLPDISSSMSCFDYDACVDAFLDSSLFKEVEKCTGYLPTKEMEELAAAMSLCSDKLMEENPAGNKKRTPVAEAFADLFSGRKSPDSEAGQNRLAKLEALVEEVSLPERLAAWEAGVPVEDIIA